MELPTHSTNTGTTEDQLTGLTTVVDNIDLYELTALGREMADAFESALLETDVLDVDVEADDLWLDLAIKTLIAARAEADAKAEAVQAEIMLNA